MLALPSLVPTKTKAKVFADVAWHIGPEAAPVLTVDVTRAGIYFEHHTLLWKHPGVKVSMKPGVGHRRTAAGAPICIAEARGPGMIAFSLDGPGRIVAIEMPLGRELEVRAYQFVAATEKLCFDAKTKPGGNQARGGHVGCTEKFASYKGDGVLWIYAYGSVFEKTLAAGESIDIEARASLYKEPTVRMETIVERVPGSAFGSHVNMTIHRFTGPGRVGVQSMSVHHRSEA